MVSIEHATLTTIEDAVPLVAAQLDDHAIPLAGEALRHALRGLVDGHGRGAVLIARDGGVAVGVAVMSFVWSLEHGGHSAWLDELFVAPERRSDGIGTALLEHALSHARASGCIGFDLEVAEGHERADHLYARTGFHRLPRRRWARRT
jgi:GNAT superfamily N-acetyltransferase